MNSTRRAFGKMMLVGAAFVLGSAGSCGNLFDDILSYIGTGLKAFSAVISLLTGNGIAIAPALGYIANLIMQGFGDLQTAVTKYQQGTPDQKDALLKKVVLTLSNLIMFISNFANGLPIANKVLDDLVTSLLSLIVGVLQGFASQLPVPSTALRTAMIRGHVIQALPIKQSEFKDQFNGKLVAAGFPQYEIK